MELLASYKPFKARKTIMPKKKNVAGYWYCWFF